MPAKVLMVRTLEVVRGSMACVPEKILIVDPPSMFGERKRGDIMERERYVVGTSL